MYKRILVPIDGSKTSQHALDTALAIAKESDGQVRVLHLVEELTYLGGLEPYGDYSGQVIKAMRESGSQLLQGALARARDMGVAADPLLCENLGQRLGDITAEEARQWNADLIVVGTHGRKGVGRMLLGSGAEQVIRFAPVPVLVIRGDQGS